MKRGIVNTVSLFVYIIRKSRKFSFVYLTKIFTENGKICGLNRLYSEGEKKPFKTMEIRARKLLLGEQEWGRRKLMAKGQVSVSYSTF